MAGPSVATDPKRTAYQIRIKRHGTNIDEALCKQIDEEIGSVRAPSSRLQDCMARER